MFMSDIGAHIPDPLENHHLIEKQKRKIIQLKEKDS